VLDLNPVIEDVGRMLRRVIGENICLESALLDAPAFVRIDQGQLGQVLVNLALNARDAMPGGGRLRVETARDTLDAGAAAAAGVPPGNYIVLAVSDTGTGISAEAMPHLFDAFFTTKADRGTGLGLATVHAIVHQAGGTIAAVNLESGGARFTIRLPEAPEGCPAAAAPSGATLDDRGSETVLVVEDEAQVRFITVSMLKARGYRVLEAATCQDALTLATTEDAIDLLVSDVVMPELSGPELATRIRTVHPTIRVLLVSGYSADAVARHGVDGGAPSFLQKPFTGIQLAKKVREVLTAAPGSRAAGPTSAVVLQ
jgi:CheY-like chemotaxis protein/two-component sensor histidine kinase